MRVRFIDLEMFLPQLHPDLPKLIQNDIFARCFRMKNWRMEQETGSKGGKKVAIIYLEKPSIYIMKSHQRGRWGRYMNLVRLEAGRWEALEQLAGGPAGWEGRNENLRNEAEGCELDPHGCTFSDADECQFPFNNVWSLGCASSYETLFWDWAMGGPSCY